MRKLFEIPGDVPLVEDDTTLTEDQLVANLIVKYSADCFSELSRAMSKIQDTIDEDPYVSSYFVQIVGGALCAQVGLLLKTAEAEDGDGGDSAREAMRLIGEQIVRRVMQQVKTMRSDN